MATRAPQAANPAATAAPIPELAPVTRTTLPFRSAKLCGTGSIARLGAHALPIEPVDLREAIGSLASASQERSQRLLGGFLKSYIAIMARTKISLLHR